MQAQQHHLIVKAHSCSISHLSYSSKVHWAIFLPPSLHLGRRGRYQQAGVAWLLERHASAAQAILADEMGLGKTVQTLVLLRSVLAADPGLRALVVCPLSRKIACGRRLCLR